MSTNKAFPPAGRAGGTELRRPRLHAPGWLGVIVKAMLVFAGCALLLALTAMGVSARVGAQPVEAIRPSLNSPAPIRPSAPVAPVPIEPAGSVAAPAIQPSTRVGPSPIQIAGPPNPALAAEVERLRATAARQAPRGSAAARIAARASWVLGLLYLHGKGVTRDTAQAQDWFSRARALGEPLASAGLAWCAIDGCTAASDPAAARPWIEQLRQVDAPRANYLEWLMENRLAPLQIASPDLRQANPPRLPNRDLLVRAANAGNIHARIELGLNSAAANRPQDAIAQFRLAAPRSEAAAANLALMQEHLASNASLPTTRAAPPALGPGHDASRAIVIQGSAASADQLFASGRRYHRGDGVPANYVEAIRLYRLAESKGSQEAHRMLALIFSRPGPGGQLDVAWMQQLANMDVSRDVPQLDNTVIRPLLRREPTPLYDLLPASWRQQPTQLIR